MKLPIITDSVHPRALRKNNAPAIGPMDPINASINHQIGIANRLANSRASNGNRNIIGIATW